MDGLYPNQRPTSLSIKRKRARGALVEHCGTSYKGRKKQDKGIWRGGVKKLTGKNYQK